MTREKKINQHNYIKSLIYLFCGILFDDEEPNRNMWGEGAYDVHNILGVLKEIA